MSKIQWYIYIYVYLYLLSLSLVVPSQTHVRPFRLAALV